jgi:hypothetical protein
MGLCTSPGIVIVRNPEVKTKRSVFGLGGLDGAVVIPTDVALTVAVPTRLPGNHRSTALDS